MIDETGRDDAEPVSDPAAMGAMLAHELREVADLLEKVPELYIEGDLTGTFNRAQGWAAELDAAAEIFYGQEDDLVFAGADDFDTGFLNGEFLYSDDDDAPGPSDAEALAELDDFGDGELG